MGLLASRLARKAGYPDTGWAPPGGWARTAYTGEVITEDKANTVAAWFAGVRAIAQDVSTLPLITYRRSGDARDRAYDHPMYHILHDAANPQMTSVVFRETLQGHLLTWGNGYAERELDLAGRTIALWPLRPDRMTVTLDGGKRKYEYQVRSGTAPIELDPARVFHIPGMGFDGLIGYSILTMARETLGQTTALREYGGRVLQNDARPGVILRHPSTLSPDAKKNITASWEDQHGGFSNAGRTAILEEGMDVTTLGLPRQDMLFVEAQKWQVAEVARWLRLAPHKIGDLERATFSNIEEQNIDHVSSTLRPWCTRWEQQIDKDLLPEPDVFAEHLMDAALRGKTLDRYQAYAVAVQNKAMTPNEWRGFENWNPVEWGEDPILTPNNSQGDPSQRQAVEALGELVRAGYEPGAALAFLGLDPIDHSGARPVTVQPHDAAEDAKGLETPPVNVTSSPELYLDSVSIGEKAADTMAAASTEGIAEGIGIIKERADRTDAVVRTSFAQTSQMVDAVHSEMKADHERDIKPIDKAIERDAKGRPVLVIETQGDRVTRRTIEYDAAGRIVGAKQEVL